MIIQCFIRENPALGPYPADWNGPFPPPYGTLIATQNGQLRFSSGHARGATGVITVAPPPNAALLSPAGIEAGEEFGNVG